MLRLIYDRLLGKKFFNKLFLINTLITILVMLVLAFILSHIIGDMLLEKEARFSSQILKSVNNYFEQKYMTSLGILQQFYLDHTSTKNGFFIYMGDTWDKGSAEYISGQQVFASYFSRILARDRDIDSVVIYKMKSNTYYEFSRNKPWLSESSTSPVNFSLNNTSGMTVLPAQMAQSNANNLVFSFISNIKDYGNDNTLGLLMLNYNPECILNSYKEYAADVKGNILILTQSGDIIYDSTGEYYLKSYPNFYLVNSNGGLPKLDNKLIASKYPSSVPGTLLSNVMPRSEIDKNTAYIDRIIYTAFFICICASFFLTYLGTFVFSRRVKTVTDAMKKTKVGDLSVRIPVKKETDEISEIATNFNIMCSDLNDFISRVYLSELKQKSAELNALQSQINPHFLYNTLEAIRMKAVTDGNDVVGEMICNLALLFRNTVKEEMVISVSNEISLCGMYLNLFKIRYNEQLTTRIEMGDEVKELGVIKHLIQPLIENYIMHGFDSGRNDNELNIKGILENGYVSIEVRDNGSGISEETLLKIREALLHFEPNSNGSIGLANVNERIKLVYGSSCGLEISSAINAGTVVRLRFKAMTKKELAEHVQSINRR